ncbi:MAG: hypothetical protein RLZZ616_3193 [Pseudomonadota bacterium]|jgi:hypothetical protein
MSALLSLVPFDLPAGGDRIPLCPLQGAPISALRIPPHVDQYHKEMIALFVPLTPSEEFACLHP